MSDDNTNGNGKKYAAKYHDSFPALARNYCLLGATNPDLAVFFGVTKTAIDNWIAGKDEFREAVLAGREQADAQVADRLYRRALGYSHPSEQIFCNEATKGEIVRAPTTKHYPPDTTAGIFWLKNRRPDLWRDRHQVDHAGQIQVVEVADEEVEPDE